MRLASLALLLSTACSFGMYRTPTGTRECLRPGGPAVVAGLGVTATLVGLLILSIPPPAYSPGGPNEINWTPVIGLTLVPVGLVTAVSGLVVHGRSSQCRQGGTLVP